LEEIDRDYIMLASRRSRGHTLKLQRRRKDKDARKYSFPNRAIDMWNQLPDEVVCVSKVFTIFRKCYDKCFMEDWTPRALLNPVKIIIRQEQ